MSNKVDVIDGSEIRGTAPFRLSSAFWDRFAAEYFEKKPVVLRNVFPEPIATEDDLFAGIVQAADAYRERRPQYSMLGPDSLRFFENWHRRLTHLDDYMPRAADQTLGGYIARVNQIDPDGAWALALRQTPFFGQQLIERSLGFMSDLVERTGLSMDLIDVDSFLGRYQFTCSGIHRDEASGLVFVIRGVKHMNIWPRERFEDINNIKRLGYVSEELLADSIVLEGHPGDMLYWPSSYWHVGHAAKSAAAEGDASTATIGFYMMLAPGAGYADNALGLLGSWVGEGLKHRLPKGPATGLEPINSERSGRTPLPASFENMIGLLESLCSDGTIRREARRMWLKAVSAGGHRPLHALPALEPVRPLAAKDRLGKPAWVRLPFLLEGENLEVGARGHLITSPLGARLESVLERLNGLTETASVSVGSLLEPFQAEADRPRVLEFLETLVSTRAIERRA